MKANFIFAFKSILHLFLHTFFGLSSNYEFTTKLYWQLFN